MSRITPYLRQDAELSRYAGTDSMGNAMYAEPVNIKCRYEQVSIWKADKPDAENDLAGVVFLEPDEVVPLGSKIIVDGEETNFVVVKIAREFGFRLSHLQAYLQKG